MKKNVLITGANKGIGFEVAKSLSQKGFNVFLTARNQRNLDNAMNQLMELQLNATPILLDVSDIKSIQNSYNQIKNQIDKLDFLINNAGILIDKPNSLLSISEEDFTLTLKNNAFSALFMIQTFLPLFSNGSKIINVSSGGGQIAKDVSTWASAYCISKTTLNAITLQFAHSLKNMGIAVNAVCPGWVRTDMGGADADRSLEEGADTIIWMAEELSSNITGKFFRDRKEIHW